ncbi:MAG: hypothetical protein V7746_26245 [Halioglobus sp.]
MSRLPICLMLLVPCLAFPLAAQEPAGDSSWALYLPVHMPGLELTQSIPGEKDVVVEADMVDLAEHANSFFALGVRYDFHAMNHPMWLDLNAWHGGYDMDMGDLDAGIESVPPSAITDFLEVNVDMKQRIVQAEVGMLLLQDWNRLDLGVTTGLRYFYQKIELSGQLPVWNSDCGRFGCFEGRPFKENTRTEWVELLLGLAANYHWHPKNKLQMSLSYGHDGSSRFQFTNRYTFENAWFGSLGWRRDAFENDGVDIVESGVYFDVGKRF